MLLRLIAYYQYFTQMLQGQVLKKYYEGFASMTGGK